MIIIKHLYKSFGKVQALNNIDLKFENGLTYGLVGQNGAGKTTLFNCIAGLENYEGHIFSDNGLIKNQLGFLPTEPYFLPKITGKEYLQLLVNARGVKGVDFNSANIFNLPLQQYAETYSTGMKKKLAITGILIQQNNIFIFDEPFNGVDIQSNFIITEIIKKLKTLNKIVLISSHIFSTLNDTCDQIYLLKNGVLEKQVNKTEFAELEQEMIQATVGTSIEDLNLV